MLFVKWKQQENDNDIDILVISTREKTSARKFVIIEYLLFFVNPFTIGYFVSIEVIRFFLKHNIFAK